MFDSEGEPTGSLFLCIDNLLISQANSRVQHYHHDNA